MNLLLLLSALLSALTGASAGVREPVAAHAMVATAGIPARATVVRGVAGTRPVAALPTPAALAGYPVVAAQRPAGLPLYASRRRE